MSRKQEQGRRQEQERSTCRPAARLPPPAACHLPPDIMAGYIELHARSAFSFLEGASAPEELIAVCLEFDMPAMALLDRNGVYGAPRFHLSAKKNGIKAHIGAEISVQSPTSKVQSHKTDRVDLFKLPVLVRNRTGYQNLCRLITMMKLRVPKHAKPGTCVITAEELVTMLKG